MKKSPDIGYSASTEWEYLDPFSRRRATTSFAAEYAEFGRYVIDILNAAKRKSHASERSVGDRVNSIRQCLAALKHANLKAPTPELWADALENWIRQNIALKERSKWAAYNVGAGLLKEVARFKRLPFRRSNPFSRKGKRDKVITHGEDLQPLIDQAKRDAIEIVKSFRAPPPEHVPFIERARALLRGGIFIVGDMNRTRDIPAGELLTDWYAQTGLSIDELRFYLYPTAKHLIPFLILLTYALAGNVESVALLRRDAAAPLVHPAYGNCFELTLEKPRAGEIYPYLVRDAGTLSVGWMIRAVLEMTQSLVPHADDHNNNLLFLAGTRYQNVASMTGKLRTTAMNRYVKKIGIPHTTLDNLRAARGVDVYNRTGDVFRVQRLLNQADFAQTIEYLNIPNTEDKDAVAIADVQRTIARGPNKPRSKEQKTESVLRGSHTCRDPQSSPHPLDATGLCVHLFWPLNDAHHVLPLEPRPVAWLLRDYVGLCEAEKSMNPKRFNAIYSNIKARIESHYLPFINDDLRTAAELLLASLPPFPKIEAL